MTKYYIEMKETKRNMMSDALLSLYRKKGPESEEARQMGLKLWDFDLKEKRMEITSDEQRVLRHALNDLRNSYHKSNFYCALSLWFIFTLFPFVRRFFLAFSYCKGILCHKLLFRLP